MDWDDFEERASRVKPVQPLKPKRYWVGVFHHGNDPQQPFNELDFVWMIGHSKITLEKIAQTYETRQDLTDIHLVYRDGDVDKSKTLKDVMNVGSNLIIFRAVRAGESFPTFGTPAPALPATSRTPNVPFTAAEATASAHSLSNRIKNEPQDGPGLHTHMSYAVPGKATSRVPTTAPTHSPLGTPTQHPSDAEDQLATKKLSQSQHYGSSAMNHTQNTLRSPLDQAQPAAPLTAAQQTFKSPTHHTINTPQIKPDSGLDGSSVLGYPGQFVRFRPQHTSYASPYGVSPLAEPVSAAARPPSPMREPYVPPVFRNKVDEPSQPFDPNNFFNRELSPQGDFQEEITSTDRSIRDIITREDPVVLEAGVAEALNVLEEFKQVFVRHATSSPDAQVWAESIDKLTPQAKRKRTVVGVVGNTGAGKSSVINAMLDEERLVPTNCMRACTAVVTEISWNDSNDTFSKYRAEIEFISREDWEKEVATLMKEFLTENGTLSRDASDQNSDAGIAWAKFHAVYPKIARDSLDECTVSNLMAETSLNVLGTTKKIHTAQSHRFYNELQKYVDSKEKVTKKDKDKDKNKQKSPYEMEYWPLIKVVKIYTKAPALSTGAVIVDLPGVHDSNAARAAVAQRYIKQCTGLWIVAPITRAVDDKAAKTLLGDSFKTQLKYDGGFSSVTFICSKTDDISITEAIDTLELEEKVESLYKQQRELEQVTEDTKSRIRELQECRSVYLLAQREIGAEIDTWDELQNQLDDGKEVFAPRPKAVKRKKQTSAKKSRKKHQAEDADSDADFVVSDGEASAADEEEEDDDNDDDDDEGVQAPQKPLTEEDIKAKLKSLKEAKKNARREGLEIKPKIDELNPTIREAETKIKCVKAEISRICISGRNEYSKRAIQQDFAAGIRELDQENAAEEDEDNFNPDEELRDYDKVAKALPVFCVSSRAYQKMCGRLQKDDAVPGFSSPEETEMPQLQAHCKKLTEAGRIQSTQNFLLSLCQLLTTFSLWASNDGSGVKMTDDDKRKQVKYVERRLNELEKGLEGSVEACLNVVKKELNEQIFDKYPDLIQEAINAAPDIAQKWGVHRADGGLAWGTYKAVTRRNGVYQSPTAGHRDFNSELVDPIVKKLATGWERAFQNRLPKAFATFIADSGKILHKFHEAVEERARENGVGLASLSTLRTQIYTYEMLFGELNQTLTELMTNLQREANRDFTPTIASIMHTVYDVCAEEHGSGSFKRMKAHMAAHVERNRHSMFNKATLTVKSHLDSMCKKLQDLMEERADEIYMKMKADYLRVLGGVQVNTKAVMSREERAMRSEIKTLLNAVDARFEPIASGVIAASVGDAGDDAKGAAEEPAASDEESVAFESANEDATAGSNNNFIMQEDASIIEPASSFDKKPSLPTPLSNEVSDEEF
ncbi:hypothetical protein EKO04_000363 [Ascochyta lentis]|uniref:Nuclear GTPase SLIP-GC n=1 Tax=Ascochyta lentis TaxID=205686 RepID=A0A8H7JAK7_9PLEO|nr:hypothetical protein EKO04_000363 [Ascochyta lentis]